MTARRLDVKRFTKRRWMINRHVIEVYDVFYHRWIPWDDALEESAAETKRQQEQRDKK